MNKCMHACSTGQAVCKRPFRNQREASQGGGVGGWRSRGGVLEVGVGDGGGGGSIEKNQRFWF